MNPTSVSDAPAVLAGASFVADMPWIWWIILVIFLCSMIDTAVQLRKKKQVRLNTAAATRGKLLVIRAISENNAELAGGGTPAHTMQALTELVSALHTAPLPSLEVYTRVMRAINDPDPSLRNLRTLTKELLEPDYVEVSLAGEPDYLEVQPDVNESEHIQAKPGKREPPNMVDLDEVDLSDPRDRYPAAYTNYSGGPRRWRWPDRYGPPEVVDGYIAIEVGGETDSAGQPVTIWQETYLHRQC